MKYISIGIALLLIIETVAGCSDTVNMGKPSSMNTVSQDDYVSRSGTRPQSQKHVHLIERRFEVINSPEYYWLLAPENFDDKDWVEKIIDIEFRDDTVAKAFYSYFSADNIKTYIGKKVFCDCVGEYDESDGERKFWIHKFRLFAK